MSSRFTFCQLVPDSLALFGTETTKLIKTPKGRQELLEAAVDFSARLIYQQSRAEWIKKWVELLEQTIRQTDSCDEAEDIIIFKAKLEFLLEQMRGFAGYRLLYLTSNILEIPEHANVLRKLWGKKEISFDELHTYFGASQSRLKAVLNNLLDVRLIQYCSNDTFCLTAEGEQITKVL